MNYLNERVAYVKGLIAGINASDDTMQGKALEAIAELMSDVVDAVTEIETAQAELDEYVTDLDEDFTDLAVRINGDEVVEVEEENANNADVVPY